MDMNAPVDDQPDSPTAETTIDVTPAPSLFAPGIRPVVLIPDAGREPSLQVGDDEATAAWVAATAAWHPALLAQAESLPRIESISEPSPPQARELRLIAAGASALLPSGHATHAADAGATIVELGRDRGSSVVDLLERAGVETKPISPELALLVEDFYALGAARWWIADLAVAMDHGDSVDLDALTRETLAGARAWAEGDAGSAGNRLRAAFEVLTQVRERFYPSDAYFVDLTLLDPASRPEELADALATRAAFTLFAPARAIEAVAVKDPEVMSRLRAAVDEGWADVVGGSYAEIDEPLLPLTSIFHNFARAAAVYRGNLDGRAVETVARRRFGLYAQLPQLARRFGFRFAIHVAFDAGKFPIRTELKMLWESPDGSTLETLLRPPFAVDRAAEAVRLPWRLAKTMRDDYSASLFGVHWAGRVSPWFADFRRVLGHSPVFMRLTTVNDFFHNTDRPYEAFKVTPDDYATPYLEQAVRRNEVAPISGKAGHLRLRSRLDGLEAVRALALGLEKTPGVAPPPLETIEDDLESGRRVEATAALDQAEPAWADAIRRGVVGEAQDGQVGCLVFNPVGFARRVAVVLPEGTPEPAPSKALRGAQKTAEGDHAVVEVAGFGFAWLGASRAAAIPAASTVSIKDRAITHPSMTVAIDPATGGVRGVHGPNEPTARLGQQLVITGLIDRDGKPALTRMTGSTYTIEAAGPGLIQATSTGSLHHPADDRVLARFSQRLRLWAGRTTLEIDVALSDLDPAWLESLGKLDPWTNYLACRWAWPDPSSTLRRLVHLGAETTAADRPETPDAIEIQSRQRRSLLLFGGLAHHARIRPRMLDTILLAGREQARTFKLGVALDLEHPWQAAVDFVTPAVVVATRSGPPAAGPEGWLIAVDSHSVAIVSVRRLERSGDGRGWGLAIVVLETAGLATRAKLRFFRDPTWARQLDFLDELIVDLPIDGDSVLIDLTPHELARIDVTLGS